MATPGILPLTAIPGWPTPAAGIMQGLAAVTPCFISPEGLHVGDVPSAEAFLSGYSGSAGELSHNQAAWLTNLAAEYAAKISAGFNYLIPGDPTGSHNYQIDPASNANIAGAGSWATATTTLTSLPAPVEPFPANFAWIDSANNSVPMTAPQCAAFSTAAAHYISALIMNNRALKNAINAAISMAQLQAVDVTAGWPVN